MKRYTQSEIKSVLRNHLDWICANLCAPGIHFSLRERGGVRYDG